MHNIAFKTTEINAVSNKDFLEKQGILEFKHGEITKTIPITILDDQSAEKDESFSLELFDAKGGVKLGRVGKTVVTIINDDGKEILLLFFIIYLIYIISINLKI